MQFLKRCIEEDVEPTLLWLKRVGPRKIIDAFVEHRCFLEALKDGDAARTSGAARPSTGHRAR